MSVGDGEHSSVVSGGEGCGLSVKNVSETHLYQQHLFSTHTQLLISLSTSTNSAQTYQGYTLSV